MAMAGRLLAAVERRCRQAAAAKAGEQPGRVTGCTATDAITRRHLESALDGPVYAFGVAAPGQTPPMRLPSAAHLRLRLL